MPLVAEEPFWIPEAGFTHQQKPSSLVATVSPASSSTLPSEPAEVATSPVAGCTFAFGGSGAGATLPHATME